MPFERLFDDANDVKIRWSKPCLLADIKADKACQDSNRLYKLIGEYNGSFKLFYIGKSETRCVWKRLLDADHKRKQDEIKNAHKHHRLMVSVGTITPEPTSISLGEIEKLLIYAHGGNPDFKRCINKMTVYNHNVLVNYSIENLGFKQDGMYREVGLGMYYRK
jgi:hypothetical protein